jgi:hypothetical protein
MADEFLDDPGGLPLDPDYDDVPDELAVREGRRVVLRTPDGEELDGVLVIVAGAWGHARRLSEGE